ncbi:elongation factor 1-gamma 1-like [Rutidosis leptorrhynchoides]|uniref:elongation factor 1-gamma 1-like n=1 Tax=Rutidosis leptorrhynchoides TaxID=125765 RepID=UPI003A98E4F5
MALIMHVGKQNANAFKTLIAAEYVGVEVKISDIFQNGVLNMSSEFRMHPIGRFPVLETPDGPVFESNAIARYVAYGSPLFGSSPIEYGQIEQWIDFSSSTLDANLRRVIAPRMGYGLQIKSADAVFTDALKKGLGVLNTHLASRTFLVGDSVTLADIITTCNLLLGFRMLMTKNFTCQFPNVERYFWNMISQPNFSKIIGEVKQVEAKPKVAEEGEA